MILLAGEITTSAWVDFEQLVRNVIISIGYDNPAYGFDGNTCAVISAVGKQSADIAQGVDREQSIGAGDQGMMFGYATTETETLMPAPIMYSHKLAQKQAELFHNKKIPWLRPDAKAQISLIYQDGVIEGVSAVVLSTQHNPEVSLSEIKEAVMEEIIKPVIPEKWLTKDTIYHINPTGKFVIGGPVGDCGLTGRKIIVDTYGGFAPHGGGAFSGKDPSKVDRSAAYAGRYVAKNIVAAGLASRCQVQLSYAIGVAEPVSISVESFGTSKVDDEKLTQLVRANFDLSPLGIINMLDLLRPIYQKTASYGHFGRELADFTWEKTDRADALKL